jgi:hypothetical protein
MNRQATESSLNRLPAPCAGCHHFRPAGSAILSAEPACGAPRTTVGSDFQAYFESRRLLLRARSAASCEHHLAGALPD